MDGHHVRRHPDPPEERPPQLDGLLDGPVPEAEQPQHVERQPVVVVAEMVEVVQPQTPLDVAQRPPVVRIAEQALVALHARDAEQGRVVGRGEGEVPLERDPPLAAELLVLA
jgi:hypothetical protein